ncbi:hypothetical protein KSP39_PZI000381 [Platanthera zijinensis]|uniref:F-box domain-containing protein n=1 Tax=Platanthera zijinensis TaxID=2320716 RepID=A0AAP0C0J3_9ASPA
MEGRSWEDLPFDCLALIFSKLGLEDLLLGVSLVCKSFHGASMDPECWKILDFEDLDFSTNSKFIPKFKHEYHINAAVSFNSLLKLCSARSHGCATKLSVPSTNYSPVLPGLFLASTKCPGLKALSLPTLLQQDDKKLPELIGNWKELETLELKWKPISFLRIAEAIGANCPKFAELRLCGVIERRDAKAIVKNLPRLKRLEMTSSFMRREDLVVILEGCRELQAVDVSRSGGFDGDDELLKPFSARIKDFVSLDCKHTTPSKKIEPSSQQTFTPAGSMDCVAQPDEKLKEEVQPSQKSIFRASLCRRDSTLDR